LHTSWSQTEDKGKRTTKKSEELDSVDETVAESEEVVLSLRRWFI